MSTFGMLWGLTDLTNSARLFVEDLENFEMK